MPREIAGTVYRTHRSVKMMDFIYQFPETIRWLVAKF